MTTDFNKERIGKGLKKILGEDQVIQDAPMTNFTSFRAGGSADLMAVPRTEEQLQAVLQYLTGKTFSTWCWATGPISWCGMEDTAA